MTPRSAALAAHSVASTGLVQQQNLLSLAAFEEMLDKCDRIRRIEGRVDNIGSNIRSQTSMIEEIRAATCGLAGQAQAAQALRQTSPTRRPRRGIALPLQEEVGYGRNTPPGMRNPPETERRNPWAPSVTWARDRIGEGDWVRQMEALGHFGPQQDPDPTPRRDTAPLSGGMFSRNLSG